MVEATGNAVSIDLEDWFCAHNQHIDLAEWKNQELRVVDNTIRLLDVLSEHSTHATFFVLGWIADRVPDLIREIEHRGHEIATHGYSHTLLTESTPAEFESDLVRALNATRKVINSDIIGYRAPSFTIRKDTTYAFDILLRNGIRYDSSTFPIDFHPDYGFSGSPLSIHTKENGIIEVPLSCAELFGKRIPCSGGGYFRIFPYSVSTYLMRRCIRQGRPLIFYLHPWEIDPGQPRRALSLTKQFRHYYNLAKTLNRFDRLLGDFTFSPIRKVLAI